MTRYMKLSAVIFALFTTGAAYGEKLDYSCLEKNDQGACVKETYYEDGYWVATCTAPTVGSCTAEISRGNKKAICTIENGKKCFARVKSEK